jgi:hypothetical protein
LILMRLESDGINGGILPRAKSGKKFSACARSVRC